MIQPLLEVRDLHTRFRTDEGVAHVVNGVDFTLNKGDTLGVVGESGCGKSVTAMSIIRLIPDPPGRIVGGQILFEGADLLKLSRAEMGKLRGGSISMVFQEPMTSLNPTFKVGSQISEVIRIHQSVSKGEARELAAEMLVKVGIPDPRRRLNEFPHQISGGMRQRVMIAMALSSHPALLMADEPTTALDVTIQAQILDLMNQLKEEMDTSYLLITHDLGVIKEMARQVMVMYAGQVVENAGVQALFKTPRHPYTQGLMASQPRIDSPLPANRMLETLPGIVPSLFALPQGCSFQGRCRRVFEKCRRKEPRLKDSGEGHLVRCWHYD